MNFIYGYILIYVCLLNSEVEADKSDDQIRIWPKVHPNPSIATNQLGEVVPSLTTSQTVGPKGPMVLNDRTFLEHMAHFDRERIPERVVHAKGFGAMGWFEVTNNITHLTKAKIFERVGGKWETLVRFSSTAPETGAADTVLDGRGFAVKFYTPEGIWDIVGLNLPVFPIRDPMLFPSMIHSRKRNPKTHLLDNNMLWDFNSLRPETTFQMMVVTGPRGLPVTARYMDGFSVHAFKMVNREGKQVYVKFHFKSDQGLKSFYNPEEAVRLAGVDPDYQLRDLYNAIENGRYPSWTMGIQVMTFEEAERYRWNPFDITKMWLESDFPVQPIGKLTLNRMPENFFEDMEQAAFDPGNLIPGIQLSPDRMLEGRTFSYQDTQRYRLGPNFARIPINRPKSSIQTYMRNGNSDFDSLGGGPNYFPNSFGGPSIDVRMMSNSSNFFATGNLGRWDQRDEDNFSQPKYYWEHMMTQKDKELMIWNLATLFVEVYPEIENRALVNFDKVSPELGQLIRARIRKVQKKAKYNSAYGLYIFKAIIDSIKSKIPSRKD